VCFSTNLFLWTLETLRSHCTKIKMVPASSKTAPASSTHLDQAVLGSPTHGSCAISLSSMTPVSVSPLVFSCLHVHVVSAWAPLSARLPSSTPFFALAHGLFLFLIYSLSPCLCFARSLVFWSCFCSCPYAVFSLRPSGPGLGSSTRKKEKYFFVFFLFSSATIPSSQPILWSEQIFARIFAQMGGGGHTS